MSNVDYKQLFDTAVYYLEEILDSVEIPRSLGRDVEDFLKNNNKFHTALPNKEDNMDEYGKVLDLLNNAVQEHVKKEYPNYKPNKETPKVFYSAYKTDSDGLPINNLDQVAVEGTCTVRYDRNCYEGYDEPPLFESFINPTHKDLAAFAQLGIEYSKDFHHIFYEGVYLTKSGFYEIQMGS